MIAFSILVFNGQDAQAQERRYRIELLVVWHLDQAADLKPGTLPTEYSAALDLLAPDLAGETGDDMQAEIAGHAQPRSDASATNVRGGQANPAAEHPAGDSPAVVWVETPSETMQQAWQRLRSSAGFRPELYFSWEQSNRQPFPVIRVHDAEVLFEQDPHAEVRAEITAGGQNGSQTGQETGAASLLEPSRYYRIDGAASFRKTRFLHLDLDLEFRALAPASIAASADNTATQTPSGEPAFEVHSLQQSRRVQTREIEYFDGPVFGVLALITRLEAETADPDLDD